MHDISPQTSSSDYLRIRRNIPGRLLLNDLTRVATLLDKKVLSQADYARFGRYSFTTYCRRFDSWKSALARVNLQPGQFRNIGAPALLDDMRRVAQQLQTSRLKLQPYLTHGLYSRKIINRLFENWGNAGRAAGLIPNRNYAHREHRGPRNINIALRFQILRQDQFRCRACGRSPATHPEITLQIDHIIPWSQGGATIPQNLQTLCNQCNCGKSDT